MMFGVYLWNKVGFSGEHGLRWLGHMLCFMFSVIALPKDLACFI
jgi:hypothetical protein